MEVVGDEQGNEYHIAMDELPEWLPISMKVSRERYQIALVPISTATSGRGTVCGLDGSTLGVLHHETYRDVEPLTRKLTWEEARRMLFWLQESRADLIPDGWLLDRWQRESDDYDDEEEHVANAWTRLRDRGFFDSEPDKEKDS